MPPHTSSSAANGAASNGAGGQGYPAEIVPPSQASIPVRAYIPTTISPEARAVYVAYEALLTAPRPAAPKSLEDFDLLYRTAEERSLAVSEIRLKQLQPSVTEMRLNGTLVYEVKPKNYEDDGTALVFVHGGGFILGSAKSSLGEAAGVATLTGKRVYDVDYTVAPRGNWKIATDQVMDAYKGVLELGYDARRIGMTGGSAGATIVAATTLKIRDAGLPMPAALVLLCPMSDFTEGGDTRYTLMEADPALWSPQVRPGLDAYAAPEDQTNPYVSPVYGDFSRGLSADPDPGWHQGVPGQRHGAPASRHKARRRRFGPRALRGHAARLHGADVRRARGQGGARRGVGVLEPLPPGRRREPGRRRRRSVAPGPGRGRECSPAWFADPPLRYRPAATVKVGLSPVEDIPGQLQAAADRGFGALMIAPGGASPETDPGATRDPTIQRVIRAARALRRPGSEPDPLPDIGEGGSGPAPAYLSDEYFRRYEAALAFAKAKGMTAILYDELGYPTGGAGGGRIDPTNYRKLIARTQLGAAPGAGPFTVPNGVLLAAVAMNVATKARIDLTDSVTEGALQWTAPGPGWNVQFFTLADGRAAGRRAGLLRRRRLLRPEGGPRVHRRDLRGLRPPRRRLLRRHHRHDLLRRRRHLLR